MSDSISITVSGEREIIANIEATLARLQKQVNEAVQGAGIDCAADAKQHCPVGTPESTGIKGYAGGRLRSSIQYVPGHMQCKVGTDVEYAWYVELGTYKMGARPFLFPAFVRAGQNLMKELRDIT